MIAPTASARDVPTQCATAPASRLPSGIIAPNTSDHTPMTRPRIWSGTMVCSTVLEVEKNSSIPNPAAKRNTSPSRKLLVNENASIATENNQTPPRAIFRGVKRCPNVATSRHRRTRQFRSPTSESRNHLPPVRAHRGRTPASAPHTTSQKLQPREIAVGLYAHEDVSWSKRFPPTRARRLKQFRFAVRRVADASARIRR